MYHIDYKWSIDLKVELRSETLRRRRRRRRRRRETFISTHASCWPNSRHDPASVCIPSTLPSLRLLVFNDKLIIIKLTRKSSLLYRGVLSRNYFHSQIQLSTIKNDSHSKWFCSNEIKKQIQAGQKENIFYLILLPHVCTTQMHNFQAWNIYFWTQKIYLRNSFISCKCVYSF